MGLTATRQLQGHTKLPLLLQAHQAVRLRLTSITHNLHAAMQAAACSPRQLLSLLCYCL
jgi:hypothetical protein